MKIASVCLGLALIAAIPFSGLAAQERTADWREAVERAAAVGEEHALLQRYVGTWTWRMREWADPAADPAEFGGDFEMHPIMGGRFVEGTFTGDGDFEARWVIGYSNVARQYQSIFYYNETTGIDVTTGAVDRDGRLVMTGATLDPATGAAYERRVVTTFLSPDEIRDVGYQQRGGREVKTFELTYTRKR